jgi:mono/diheme cytochrome c family protein
MKLTLKGAVCSAILLLFVVLLVESGITGSTLQKSRSAGSASRKKRVDELFNRNCARCHGADGRGDTPLGHTFNAPNFNDPEWWEENSAISSTRSLRSIVTRGKAGMPAFGKKLTKPEINLLVDHVRSFPKLQRKS